MTKYLNDCKKHELGYKYRYEYGVWSISVTEISPWLQ